MAPRVKLDRTDRTATADPHTRLAQAWIKFSTRIKDIQRTTSGLSRVETNSKNPFNR